MALPLGSCPGDRPMDVQWYPGHMAKTRRMIAQELKNVDAVCEIRDARIPNASRNPDIEALVAGKPGMVVLNRADLADPAGTRAWADWLHTRGLAVLACCAKDGRGTKQFPDFVRSLLAEKLASYAAKGQTGRILRVMVLGIPNVGKSTFINQISRRKTAKAEDRPGVTRSKQRVPVDAGLELLDTPGMLWPKLDDRKTALYLAFTGAVRDEVLDREELAAQLMEVLAVRAPQALVERCRVTDPLGKSGYDLLEEAARGRGFLCRGGTADRARMADILLDEFRAGRMGRFTLEMPGKEVG